MAGRPNHFAGKKPEPTSGWGTGGNPHDRAHEQAGTNPCLRTFARVEAANAPRPEPLKNLDNRDAWNHPATMQTTVTTKNMVTIPAELSRRMGITPGCRLEWQEPKEGSDEVNVRVIPTRAARARKLMGAALEWSPERDAVAELLAEREREEKEQVLP
jgi:bifunctional DNA-binding transcriptional regulator/antitoxin component of YhaV-PrlF toxin-antitoxin module